MDTSGAYCGIEAEERGQGQAIAQCITEMMALKTPVLSIIIGEGGSGGALALAAASRVWMLENATYSVISPEGCASILWKDASRAPDAAECLRLTAKDALALSVIEHIVPEKDIGKETFYAPLKNFAAAQLRQLLELPGEEVARRRYLRFRRIGTANLMGDEDK
ncbi:Acetyl-coenzyme A carboxylase carboxyl transferase subunit alpha [bioreactor metagenome]|uniref:acetyl-CoA carboxytransferase n=1 Tax=bioreactor metagenome TaxID=1076179 RepID=A0A645IBC6_9ZZZZ